MTVKEIKGEEAFLITNNLKILTLFIEKKILINAWAIFSGFHLTTCGEARRSGDQLKQIVFRKWFIRDWTYHRRKSKLFGSFLKHDYTR